MSPRQKIRGVLVGFLKSQFFRFLVASGINTLFGFLAFSFFIFLGFRYPIAVLFSTACGILFNFQTIGRLVFFSRDNRLIFRFVLVYIATYLLFTFGVGILIRFHLSAYASGAIMAIPIGVASFLLNKRLVFKK